MHNVIHVRSNTGRKYSLTDACLELAQAVENHGEADMGEAGGRHNSFFFWGFLLCTGPRSLYGFYYQVHKRTSQNKHNELQY